jgi:hypothetical protein
MNSIEIFKMAINYLSIHMIKINIMTCKVRKSDTFFFLTQIIHFEIEKLNKI